MTGNSRSRSGGTKSTAAKKSTAKKSASTSAKAEDEAKAAGQEQPTKAADDGQEKSAGDDDGQTPSQKRDESAQEKAEAKADEDGKVVTGSGDGDEDETRTRAAGEEAAEQDQDEQSDFENHPQRTADPDPKTGQFNVDTNSEHPDVAPLEDVTGGIEGATQANEPKNAITENEPPEAATPQLQAMETYFPGTFEGVKKDTVPVPGGAELKDLSEGRDHKSTPAGSIEDGTFAGVAHDLVPVAAAEQEDGSAPSAARLTPPPGDKRTEVENRTLAPTTLDALAIGLNERESSIRISGSDEVPNPDDLFDEQDGVYVSKHRLVEDAVATRYERESSKLVLAKGKQVSKQAAEAFTAKVRADQS